jgi:hypothetical protein
MLSANELTPDQNGALAKRKRIRSDNAMKRGKKNSVAADY